ncbi:hypothetical protein IAR55_004389 [Kwoniella newhampshirensis]|uniref:Uncharacterized protein n=1 Tax=Kwoniella newhampshirensis TaxID=1651941 RepID=A0AAW0YXS8_9TREE
MFAQPQDELFCLSAREKMQMAKIALIEAESEEAEAKRLKRKQSRKKSYALSLDGSEADSDMAFASSSTRSRSSSSRSVSASKSILRRPIPTSVQPDSPTLTAPSILPSPAPSGPLPPAPNPMSLNTDFGPPVTSGSYENGSGSSTITPHVRRRSSRVRFSDQPLPTSPQPNLTMPNISRPTSLRALRRESSIDGLRSDLVSASGSLSKRSSIASSIASDPWAWRSSSIVSEMAYPSSHEEEEEIEEAFKPQILPYPKIPPALSRLSIETSASSEWSPSLGTSSPGSVTSPTLKNTLNRPSLDSVTHLPSLEARVAGSDGSIYYAPSYMTDDSSLDNDYERHIGKRGDSTSSSLSIQIPPKSYPSPYAALLPRRRSSLAAYVVSANMPPTMNREAWNDSDLGLSPRSGAKMLETQLRESRKSSLGTESIIAEIRQEPESFEESDNGRIPSIDLPPSSIHEPTTMDVVRGHLRTDSGLSAIMAFPVPPDRERGSEVKITPGPVLRTGLTKSVLEAVETAERAVVVEVDGVVIIDKEATPAEEDDEVLMPVEEVSDSGGEQDQKTHKVDRELSLNSPSAGQPPVLSVQTPEMGFSGSFTDDLNEGHAKENDFDPGSRPASPEMHQLLTSLPKARRPRRLAIDAELETEESDIDLSTPLITAALRSKIITPHSRLVSQSSPAARPTQSRTTSANSVNTESLKTGMGLTSGRGWSGSESEEEEWVAAVRSVSQRKAASRSPSSTYGLDVETRLDSTPTHKRFSSTSYASSSHSIKTGASKSFNYRLSQLSTLSGASTIELDMGPLTPAASMNLENLTPQVAVAMIRNNSVSSTSSSVPGDFPWGQSSPPASPSRGLFPNSPTGRKASKDGFPFSGASSPLRTPTRLRDSTTLPPPEREVEGWGEPEVLMDDQYFDGEFSRAGSSNGSVGSRRAGTISTFSLGSRSSLLARSDDEIEHGSSVRRRPTMGARGESGEKTPKAEGVERAPSPDIWSSHEAKEERLMDEQMPEDLGGDWHDHDGQREEEVQEPTQKKVVQPRKSMLRQPTQIRIRTITS